VAIGGTVSFYLNTLLLPGDDDIASVSADVDDVAEVCRGEVVEVTDLVLLSLHHVFSMLGTFGVSKPVSFSLNVIFIFYLHDILGVVNMVK
jgi:hypothetical protein